MVPVFDNNKPPGNDPLIILYVTPVPVAETAVDVLTSSEAVDKNPTGVIQIGLVINYFKAS